MVQIGVKIITAFLGAVCLFAVGLSSTQAADEDIMVVFDASGSMWGQIDGTTKIEIARKAFKDLSSNWSSAGRRAGLIAYGHRRKGDCSDIEIISRPSIEASAAMAAQVSQLTPKGKTPLSAAVRQAADVLKFTENAATVILLSDGIETCNLDPCAVGTELEQLGINFTAHVIGFGIQKDADKAQLQCLAENTGGKYIDANNADELDRALEEVASTPKKKIAPATTKISLGIEEVDGAARPGFVEFTATNKSSGETKTFKRLEGADQVISGLPLELENGTWIFTATGDAGKGEVTVTLNGERQRVLVPYKASGALFELLDKGPFLIGKDINFRLKANGKLEENATYTLWLFPAGPSSFDQHITYTSRFGTDQGVTEHKFWNSELQLPAGEYEIIILKGENDLNSALARFPIKIVDKASDLRGTPSNITVVAQLPNGTLPVGRASWSFLRQGEQDVRAPVTESAKGTFQDFAPGQYQAEVLIETATGNIEGRAEFTVTANGPKEFVIPLLQGEMQKADIELMQAEPLVAGDDHALSLVPAAEQGDVLLLYDEANTLRARLAVSKAGSFGIPSSLKPASYSAELVRAEQKIARFNDLYILPQSADTAGNHSTPKTGGEDASTMMSAEELAAEKTAMMQANNDKDRNFNTWKECTNKALCFFADPRVNLRWTVPSLWAVEEPFFYTTAGGAQAPEPTVHMASRLMNGSFRVALNPHQWGNGLGPCEPVLRGTLCREGFQHAQDEKDYAIIRAGLMEVAGKQLLSQEAIDALLNKVSGN